MSATKPIMRLKKRADFQRTAALGRKWVTPAFVVQVAPRDPSFEPEAAIRVGFTASRKVGKAVARNRAKRRLRALVAQALPKLGKAGYDYVLIARAAVLDRDFAVLEAELAEALRRLGKNSGSRHGPFESQTRK